MPVRHAWRALADESGPDQRSGEQIQISVRPSTGLLGDRSGRLSSVDYAELVVDDIARSGGCEIGCDQPGGAFELPLPPSTRKITAP
mgnify:CR=1 FL=1|jgi:hypothetical protein